MAIGDITFIGRKTKLVFTLSLIVISVLYYEGYKFYDNTNLKKNVQKLEIEVKKMENESSKIEEIKKINFFNKWYVVTILNKLGYNDVNFDANNLMITYKIPSSNILLMYREYLKCQSIFSSSCYVRRIYPLEIGIYVKD